jgi:hypothetical protein
VAVDAVNFVDEWTRGNWPEVRDWSSQANLSALSRVHRLLRGRNGDFTELRSCSIANEVQVVYSEFRANGADGPSWYYIVRHTGDDYTMVSISSHPNGFCKGHNRISSITEK